MSAAEEIKALREEIAKLRERVAVLEAQPYRLYPPAPVYPPYYPVTVPGTPFTPFYEVTCTDGVGQVTAAPKAAFVTGMTVGKEN